MIVRRFARVVAVLTTALAVTLPAASARADTAADAMARGDAAYARADLVMAQSEYTAGLAAAPHRFPLLWRLARVESERSEDAKGDDQRELTSNSVIHARDAVASAPDSALGHVWLAVALGRQALREGPKTRLSLAREVKSEVDRAIEIDPTIGRAYHVRAAWNRKIASLSTLERFAANSVLGGVPKGATMDNAVRDFEKAIELEPNYLNHHLELGRTYMDLHREDDARREFEKVLSLPPVSNPRDPHYQADARELLGKLKKKD
jgi:tetratricopeptide (TPR) repeat protein